MQDLRELYFEWICGFVFDDHKYSKKSFYEKLLRYLWNFEFSYTIGLDGNRAADGEDLRYRFGREFGYSDSEIACTLDVKPCSILEMMIALSIRCEVHIMEDYNVGDRTGQWFWNMIVSLGLGSMTDDRFDDTYVQDVLTKFLNREYERNGKGGLFTVEHCQCDMRSIEIWYQMCMFLDSII